MEELWKDIKGYEGLYQVSNLGNVKSLERLVYNQHNNYIKPERILKPRRKEDGYLQVYLYNNGKKQAYVHRLVAESFIPNTDNKAQVNHIDFNKENNIVENLEWVTAVENLRHYRKSDKWEEMNRQKKKKLASKTIYRIKKHKDNIIKLYKNNYKIEDIAKLLKVGRDFVSDVLYLYDFI